MNYINNNENNMLDEEHIALIEGPKAKSGFYLSTDNKSDCVKINESRCVF